MGIIITELPYPFTVSLLESDFMPSSLFVYVTAVVLSEKMLTGFLLQSFWKAFSANSIASNCKTFMW